MRKIYGICALCATPTYYSPGEYKPEDYMKGNYESVIRNATIAKILYLNKSIEQFGSGLTACAKMPEYASHMRVMSLDSSSSCIGQRFEVTFQVSL